MKFYQKLLLTAVFQLWLSLVVSAQSRVVTGTVKDDAGTAVPGANVIIKGTNSGTTTDGEGKYSISVENDNAVLVVSFIGFIKNSKELC